MFLLIINDLIFLFISFLLFFFIHMLSVYKYIFSSILNNFIIIVYFICCYIFIIRFICSFFNSIIFNITF